MPFLLKAQPASLPIGRPQEFGSQQQIRPGDLMDLHALRRERGEDWNPLLPEQQKAKQRRRKSLAAAYDVVRGWFQPLQGSKDEVPTKQDRPLNPRRCSMSNFISRHMHSAERPTPHGRAAAKPSRPDERHGRSRSRHEQKDRSRRSRSQVGGGRSSRDSRSSSRRPPSEKLDRLNIFDTARHNYEDLKAREQHLFSRHQHSDERSRQRQRGNALEHETSSRQEARKSRNYDAQGNRLELKDCRRSTVYHERTSSRHRSRRASVFHAEPVAAPCTPWLGATGGSGPAPQAPPKSKYSEREAHPDHSSGEASRSKECSSSRRRGEQVRTDRDDTRCTQWPAADCVYSIPAARHRARVSAAEDGQRRPPGSSQVLVLADRYKRSEALRPPKSPPSPPLPSKQAEIKRQSLLHIPRPASSVYPEDEAPGGVVVAAHDAPAMPPLPPAETRWEGVNELSNEVILSHISRESMARSRAVAAAAAASAKAGRSQASTVKSRKPKPSAAAAVTSSRHDSSRPRPRSSVNPLARTNMVAAVTPAATATRGSTTTAWTDDWGTAPELNIPGLPPLPPASAPLPSAKAIGRRLHQTRDADTLADIYAAYADGDRGDDDDATPVDYRLELERMQAEVLAKAEAVKTCY